MWAGFRECSCCAPLTSTLDITRDKMYLAVSSTTCIAIETNYLNVSIVT